MCYVKLVDGKVSEIASGNKHVAGFERICHIAETYDEVDDFAVQISKLKGEEWIPIDRGDWCSPRFDVIRAPKVGDKVSYTFNGDYYPCGEITRISANLRRITTSDGTVFYRKKQSGQWLRDGMWAMVAGHRSEKNFSF